MKPANFMFSKSISRCVLLTVFSGLLCAPASRAEEPAATVSLADAVQNTLANQLGVQVTRSKVTQSRGTLQTASGQFDWDLGAYWATQVDRAPTGRSAPFLHAKTEDTTTYTIGLGRMFRSGLSVTQSVTAVDYKDNYSQYAPVSQANVSVTLKVPLLRGFGTKHAGATEMAAKLGLKAQEYATQYTVEQLVYQTAAAYWNCLTAARDVAIADAAEKRAQEIFKVVQTFANGGELDHSTLDQARARLAVEQASRESAELAYYQSRQALGQAMGYTSRQLLSPPLPAGEFPAVLGAESFTSAMREKYSHEALARRADYLAAGLNADAQAALLEQARNNLKPKLDASVQVGYAGMDTRSDRMRPAFAVSNNIVGANALTTVTLDWPMANNAARGSYLSQKAVAEQARFSAALAGTDVTAGVLNAIELLKRTSSQYALATRAVENYRRAVEQVNANLRIGEATLTDVIDVEDRYVSALQLQNSTHDQYAIALALIRLYTGTLTSMDDHQAVFRLDSLTELPFPTATP